MLADSPPAPLVKEKQLPSPLKNAPALQECSSLKKGAVVKSSFSKFPITLPNPQCISSDSPTEKEGIVFGNYFLENNAWNSLRSTWKWKQCVGLIQSETGIKYPTWNYDWGDEDSVQEGFYEWVVRSHPRIVYGVSGDSSIAESCERSGLPASYAKLPKFKIEYSISSTQTDRRKGDLEVEGAPPIATTGGDRNAVVTIDFYESCLTNPAKEGFPAFRFMIWIENGPERTPTGLPSTVGAFTDSLGRKFNVFDKVIEGEDAYLGFTVVDEKSQGTIVLSDFVNYAQANAEKFGTVLLKDSWCLMSVSLGTEIWWGEGTFAVEKFDIIRSY